MTDTNDLAQTDAPERIWAWPGNERGWYAACCSDEQTLSYSDIPYILATREALAKSPEVQRLVAEARAEGVAEGLDRAVGMFSGHKPRWLFQPIASALRAAAAALRGEEKP